MALKYLYVPSGYKSSTAYGVLPNDSSADFDQFERNTFATRTNKDGLLETHQTFGNNLVTNGDFATDSDWSLASGITISGGKANFNNTANGDGLQQNNILTTGKRYEVTFTISDYEKGSIKVRYPFIAPSINSDGVHTVTGIAVYSSGSDDLRFQVTGETTLSIDDVSVKEIALNIPRIDYLDGGCPSLLLEPLRTNQCRASEDVMAWEINGGADRASKQVISPDGSKSADLVTTDSVNAGVFSLEMTTISNTVYSTSVYAKHISGGSKLRFGITSNLHFDSGDKIIVVDLSDGSIVSNQLGGVAEPKVIDVGNGWYRLMIEHSNVVSGGGGGAKFICYAEEGSFSQFSVWGGQIEVGGYTSSYIPNINSASGGQTTRNRDKGNFAGDFDVLKNDSGVFEVRFKAFETGSSKHVIALTSDGTVSEWNRIYIGYGYSAGVVKPYLALYHGGSEDDEASYVDMPSSFNIFDYNTYKFKYEAGNNQLKINGKLVTINNTDLSELYFLFGQQLKRISFNEITTSTSSVFYGGVKHIKIYDSITDF